MKSLFAIMLSLSWLAFFTYCQNNKPLPAEIVARVGDAYLTKTTVLELLPPNLPESDKPYYIQKIVETWIDRQVLFQSARQSGVKLSPIDEFQIETLRQELLNFRFLNQTLPKEVLITDQEIEDYYQHNQVDFVRDEDEVHLVHLFLEKLDRAIVKEIRETKLLMDVIKKNYMDRQITPVREKNGDLGYVPLPNLRPEFRKAIRGTKTGVIYGPIRTGDGYHYLQVLDRQKKGTVRSLELVVDEIRTRLRMEKQQAALGALKASLRNQIEIETFFSNIN